MPDDIPKFDTAQYSITPSSTTSGPERCFSCNVSIAGPYYRVDGKMACEGCADRFRREKPNTHAAFMRGLLFGAGAALLGLVLYALFTIVTGFYVGYVALGVGWLVAKAIMTGSKGIGGRRFQLTAILLTYCAISMAEIPIWLYHFSHQADKANVTQSAKDDRAASESEPATEPKSKPTMSFGAAIGELVLLGLASPFIELQAGAPGVIGLVILFVGLRIAWRMTRDDGHVMQIDGPFGTSAAPA